LHNEMIKSRRMRYMGHVADMEKKKKKKRKNLYEALVGKPLEDLGIDGRIILQLILKK